MPRGTYYSIQNSEYPWWHEATKKWYKSTSSKNLLKKGHFSSIRTFHCKKKALECLLFNLPPKSTLTQLVRGKGGYYCKTLELQEY